MHIRVCLFLSADTNVLLCSSLSHHGRILFLVRIRARFYSCLRDFRLCLLFWIIVLSNFCASSNCFCFSSLLLLLLISVRATPYFVPPCTLWSCVPPALDMATLYFSEFAFVSTSVHGMSRHLFSNFWCVVLSFNHCASGSSQHPVTKSSTEFLG